MAADTKVKPTGNVKSKKKTTVPTTRYELLMRLNSDWIWIAKQNNQPQA